MVLPLWMYAFLLAAAGVLALFGIDRIVKVGSRGGDADISLNAIFFTGLLLTLTFVVVTIAVFTGALFVVPWLIGGLSALLVGLYFLRRVQASRDAASMAEQLADEESVVAETSRRDPSNTAAWQRLSELSERKGDYPAALRCLRKVCELEPGELNDRKMRELKQRATEALKG